MRRGSSIRYGLQGLVLVCAGCLPFFGAKREPPRTPAAVQRFAAAAAALGVPPSPTPLPEATRQLAGAVESLPNAPGARDRGSEIEAQAQAMHGGGGDTAAAQRSVELALQGLGAMRKPAGAKDTRARSLAEVKRAVVAAEAYRALARALVLFTGGPSELAAGVELPALVARFAVEDDEGARRTGAQAVHAIVEELRARQAKPGDLAERAERLARAEALEYAPMLRDALERVVEALGGMHVRQPAFDILRSQAHDAVQRIARERPFELQRPAAQDALRLIADAITVAAGSGADGR